ncbi:hypothetical protein R3P38DRAFT_1441877 [Favolaschia claudopus]|uniref:Uncharacterized protein n=1 Tax=Favolaschia claudopus TaxID=2862362 RepID=A0AAW0ANT7_9AGAR
MMTAPFDSSRIIKGVILRRLYHYTQQNEPLTRHSFHTICQLGRHIIHNGLQPYKMAVHKSTPLSSLFVPSWPPHPLRTTLLLGTPFSALPPFRISHSHLGWTARKFPFAIPPPMFTETIWRRTARPFRPPNFLRAHTLPASCSAPSSRPPTQRNHFLPPPWCHKVVAPTDPQRIPLQSQSHPRCMTMSDKYFTHYLHVSQSGPRL